MGIPPADESSPVNVIMVPIEYVIQYREINKVQAQSDSMVFSKDSFVLFIDQLTDYHEICIARHATVGHSTVYSSHQY